jgi:NAD(P)-dependent dehydrogenase (short-subunit alcohol dehydrogenase family)
MTTAGMPAIRELFDLTGRTALITGAASGFGEAIALGFAEFGCDIVAADIDLDNAKCTASKVESKGRQALALRMDVGKPEEVREGFRKAAERFNGLDILVNSAGVAPHEPAEDTALETWDWAIDINLRGAFLCCQEAARLMFPRGKGSIVNISSIAAHIGFPRGVAIFSASKGGMDAFTRQLAIEWSGRGIRVNSIAPCQFMTPGLRKVMDDPQFDPEKLMQTWTTNIPMGRVGEAWEIIGPVLFLASDASSMITGVCLPVDGGYLAR